MKRISIKQAFGTEPQFTKFISKDKATQERLLTALNMSYDDGFTIKAEVQTQDNKRVDLVVKDSEGENALVIESQDCSGWLDALHASKILYYMHDKKCDTGVLLCEDANEHIKSYVQRFNTDSCWDVYVLIVLVYETSEGAWVDFQPLMRPNSIMDKRVRRVGNPNDSDKYRHFVEKLLEAAPQGLFTNDSKHYASCNDLGKSGFVIMAKPRMDDSWRVNVMHGGKYDTDSFKTSFRDFCSSLGYDEVFENSDKCYVRAQNLTDCIDLVQQFKQAVMDGTITQ
jgi:hypothetical protein